VNVIGTVAALDLGVLSDAQLDELEEPLTLVDVRSPDEGQVQESFDALNPAGPRGDVTRNHVLVWLLVTVEETGERFSNRAEVCMQATPLRPGVENSLMENRAIRGALSETRPPAMPGLPRSCPQG
jgi:hypothetical protein